MGGSGHGRGGAIFKVVGKEESGKFAVRNLWDESPKSQRKGVLAEGACRSRIQGRRGGDGKDSEVVRFDLKLCLGRKGFARHSGQLVSGNIACRGRLGPNKNENNHP